MPQVSLDAASTQFMRDGRHISYASVKWIQSARLNVLPLNAAPIAQQQNKNLPSSVMCRKCASQPESLAHVLCHCPIHLPRLITGRHNNALNIIHTALKPHFTQIHIDKTTNLTNTSRRPDIVALNENTKQAAIIDITCTFEAHTQSFINARTHKRMKYKDEAAALTSKGYSVLCDAIVIGALGSWDPNNDKVLLKCGVSRSQIYQLKRTVIGNTIEYGRRIYWEHILGQRYIYFNNSDLATLNSQHTQHTNTHTTQTHTAQTHTSQTHTTHTHTKQTPTTQTHQQHMPRVFVRSPQRNPSHCPN
jgi:hypothetical protein